MRTWLFYGVVSCVLGWGLLVTVPPAVQMVPPAASLDPGATTNPLRYPLYVSVMLLGSVVAYLVDLPGEVHQPSPTRVGWAGPTGFCLWLAASVALGTMVLGPVASFTDDLLYRLSASTLVMQSVFLGAGYGFLVVIGRVAPFNRLFLRVPTYVGRGVLAYARLFPFIALGAYLNMKLVNWLEIGSGVPKSLYFVASAQSTGDWVLLAVVMVVLAPVGEEFFFRGVLYNLCRGWTSPWVAAFLSALVFTAVHREPLWFLPILILGIGLALAYEHTDRLTVPVVMHAVQNGISLGILYVTLGG
jgi:membrane protease YdiL (CAAX protease family)